MRVILPEPRAERDADAARRFLRHRGRQAAARRVHDGETLDSAILSRFERLIGAV